MVFELPEASLAAEHPARLLWRVLETLDLTAFTRGVKSVEGTAGRRTHGPRLLLALWLYGISQGVGSAREIARRVQTDRAFSWIAGEVPISHDVLTSFRDEQGLALEKLMTDVLGVLLHKELLSLEHVAIDGTRVRASASAPSFRRSASLARCREQAELHLKAVLAGADDPEVGRAQQRARESAAKALMERVDAAAAEVMRLESLGKDRPRASTTDPEARVMKMPDGGFRPAYNVQLAVAGKADGGPRTIVAARVVQEGNDYSGLEPLVDQIRQRTGRYPDRVLADGGHASHAGIAGLEARGIEGLISVPDHEKKPRESKPSEAVMNWRARMDTDEAKVAYRARAGLCELANAHLKSRLGLHHLLVRGLTRAANVVLLSAIAFNLLQHGARLLG